MLVQFRADAMQVNVTEVVTGRPLRHDVLVGYEGVSKLLGEQIT